MMIMRPPQQGQGCFGVCGSLALVLAALMASIGSIGSCEQLACSRDVLGTLAAGEQAVVADAMEARWQHMDQEAADELAGCERHHLVALAAFDPVVLPLEGDVLVVERDQAAVGDGDAMSVAREIAQHFLGSAEWAFAIDHPFAVAQWRQIGGERLRIGQRGMIAEELQLAGLMSGDELLQEQPAEQSRQHAHR